MPTLNPALKDFWTKPARNRVLYGGRSSSKSWDAAGFAIFAAQQYSLRFLCTRQFQNKIAESVYELLKMRAHEFGIGNQFSFKESSITHRRTGSEFIFYGLARNINEIKSLEGIDIAWHEECQLLTEEQWKILDPTLRKQGSQHWLIFNPRFATDFTYQRFVVNPPPDTVVRKINYDENPFLSDTIKAVIAAAYQEDPEAAANVYGGIPLSDDDRVVIKSVWIEAAVDAHKKFGFEPSGKKRLGFDVADDGDDKCANVYAYGSVVSWCEEWKGQEDELLKSCSRTFTSARNREAEILYDCIGVGAHCGAKFSELNEAQKQNIPYTKFNAGDAVHNPNLCYVENGSQRIKNKDYFSNLKAQVWWLVADRFRNTYDSIKNGTKYADEDLISIDSGIPHLAQLKAELSTPRRDFDANGRVKVESKIDLKKRGVKSPNLADAFVMCFSPVQAKGILDFYAKKVQEKEGETKAAVV